MTAAKKQTAAAPRKRATKKATSKAVLRNKAKQRMYVRLAEENRHGDVPQGRADEILEEEAKKLGLKPRVVWS